MGCKSTPVTPLLRALSTPLPMAMWGLGWEIWRGLYLIWVQIRCPFDASAAGTQYPFAYGDVGSEHTYINREGAITVTQFVTLGNPVLTLTSLATNDDPVEILYQ